MDIKKVKERYFDLLVSSPDADELGYLHYLHSYTGGYGTKFPEERYNKLIELTKEFDNYLFEENPVMDDLHNEVMVCRDTFIIETVYAIANDEDRYLDFYEKILQS